MQERTLGEIARHVGGQVRGDPSIAIRAAATLGSAGDGDISFLMNPKYERQLQTTKASAVIVGQATEAPVALLVAEDPYYAFTQVMVLLHGHRKHKETGISPQAFIADTAALGEGCHVHNFATIADDVQIGRRCIIYPCAYIGEGATLGDDCIVYPSVTIYERCRIGHRVIINAGSAIGVDGFGYATHKGLHYKIPQVGGIVIEDDVEIGSCCGVERGTLDDTIIGQGSKLGDLVTIGHGTKVGPHCLLVAQVGIAGSATLGHHCVVAGQAGIVGHITVGNNVTIGARAGVINSVPDGQTVLGAPAFEADEARRVYAMLPYLPRMRQEIRDLGTRLRKIAAIVELDDDSSDDDPSKGS
ncbi:MAG: UDP-3-O-(3-hydroxymyristoyl)glucosamine N-acyltransferase [Sedimentisphaerales bacterium]|nr:UDP-3-O-(3-hydroxymyristoyl)glucosamine N-acyltransferase [Sedimentisphaerales bacterium]